MRKIAFVKSVIWAVILLAVFVLPVFATEFPAQQNVPLDKEWRIRFNQPIDNNSLKNIVLQRTDIIPITVVDIYPELDPEDPSVVIIKHSIPFVLGASYKLTVDTGVTNISGAKLTDSASQTFTTETVGSINTIKIGALLPLTGTWSEAGQGEKKAFTVGLAKVNYYLKDSGIQFELDIQDTESNAAKALQELESMKTKGINTVLGPMSSEESMKVLDFANKNSILLVSPSATSMDLALKDNFFRTIASDATQVDGLTHFMNKKYAIKKLMTVYFDDNYGRGYYGELQKVTGALGMEMLGGIPLAVDSPDYASIVSQLEKLAADADSKNTAIVLVSSGQTAAELIKNISTNSKLASLKWFAGADIIGSKAFLEDKSVADFAVKTKMEGMTIGYKDLALDALPYIGEVLEGATDLSPYAITAWDSLWLLANTYKEAPKTDVETLKQTLSDVAKRYRNASGAINVMDENGDTIGARFMRYQLEAIGDSYTWRCLGFYNNIGVGEPIIQSIKWTVAEDGGTVQVGVLLPLSGSQSEKGKEIQSIIIHAADSFNKYATACGSDLQIKLVEEDTGSDPQKAEAAAEKLVGMGIKNIIGPIASSELEKIKPLVDSSQIILISPLSSSPSLATKDQIYRLILNDSVQTKAIAELMSQDGIKKVVLLNRDDTYGNDMAKAFQKEFEGEVTVLTYDPTKPDLATLLKQAEDIVQQGNAADTAVLAVSYAEIVDIMKGISDNSSLNNVRWFGTDSSALSNELLDDQQAVQRALKVNYTASDYTPYGKYFNPLYQVINHTLQPAQPFKESSVTAFDGLWLLGCAYLENGTSADTSVINEYVAKRAFCGVGGVLALDENGDRRFGYYKFYQVSEMNGKTGWDAKFLYSVDHANNGKLEMLP